MDGDTEVIRNLLVPMGSAFNPCESGEAALLELSAGVVGRLPTGHVASLSTQIFAVINKCRMLSRLVLEAEARGLASTGSSGGVARRSD